MGMVGAVLAGGLSRRMEGLDKRFLMRDGVRVLEHVARTLSAVCERVVVIARNEHEVQFLSRDLTVQVIPDRVEDCGPMGGLHTAFETFGEDTFLAACDLPFVDQRVAKKLAERASNAQADIIMPRVQDPVNILRENPCFAIYRPTLTAFVRRSILDRRLALRSLIPHVICDFVDLEPDLGLTLRNVNLRSDLIQPEGTLDSTTPG